MTECFGAIPTVISADNQRCQPGMYVGDLGDAVRLLSPPGPDQGKVPTVGKGASVIAFYKAASGQQQVCSEAVRFLEQIIRDRGLLERCVAERFLTHAFVDGLLKDYATIRETPPPLPNV